jgi:glucose/arabinose dehydrogenase
VTLDTPSTCEISRSTAAVQLPQCIAATVYVSAVMRALYPLGVLTIALAVAAVAQARGEDAAGLSRPAPELQLEAGWSAERYAIGLRRPTALAFGPDGRLYAAQESGEIVVVPRNTTRPLVLARGFKSPLGIAWSGTRLFVSSTGRLDSLKLVRGKLRSRRSLLRGLPHGRHQQDNVVVGRDGRLYIGNGSTCDVCTERDRRSATILAVRQNGRGLAVFARGLRNPYGLAVQPGTGRLYATVNGQDDLGEEPAEALVHVRRGSHYGWPQCWPSFARKRLVGRCRGVTPPAAYLEPRSGAGSLAFADERTVYVALWGQYFGRKHGRTLVRLTLNGNGRAMSQRVFARGFDHPLAVIVDRAGSIYVSDWGRGIVYRIKSA